MNTPIKAMSFVPRFLGAFGQFFKYLGNGVYAARCQQLAAGELLACEVEAKTITQTVTETVEVIREIEVVAPTLDTVSVDGAYQLLQLLQQEARFIDFIQETIDGYDDAEVGAAARQIHAGCAKVIQQHFTIAAVNDGAENSRVEVPVDYDVKQIKLAGRVEGDGPYAGTLIHPGWKVLEARLPQISSTASLHILAPAEVEV